MVDITKELVTVIDSIIVTNPITVTDSIIVIDSINDATDQFNSDAESMDTGGGTDYLNTDTESIDTRDETDPLNTDLSDLDSFMHQGFTMFTRLRILIPINNLNRNPLIYRKTIFRPDGAKWSETIQKKLNSLSENNTWTLQQAPAERHILKGKWVYKKKLAGTSIKYKAR